MTIILPALLPRPIRDANRLLPAASIKTRQNFAETYAQGYADSHPGVIGSKAPTAYLSYSAPAAAEASWFSKISTGFKSGCSSLFNKLPESVKTPATNFINWGKTPISDTGIYTKFAGAAEKGIAKVAEGAAEGSARASFASGATKFLGKIGSVAKGFPLVGVVISTLCEIPAIFDGFKEGRGAAQIMKSGVAVAGTTVGAIALAALAANPVSLTALALGAVGGIAGNWIGDKIGGGLFGSNRNEQPAAAAHSPAPAYAAQQAPRQFGSVTNPNGMASFDINNPLQGLPPLA
ncbi:MAG: hypothetical protein WCG23_03415 [bacterium]